MHATFHNTDHGNIVQLDQVKYVVMGKRDMIVLASYPSQKDSRAFEPEEFNSLHFIKVD